MANREEKIETQPEMLRDWRGWKGRSGPYLIAEIGGNHEGDFNSALELTRLACNSGVDAVKYQIYTGDSLVSRVESPDRHQHFQRFELARDQYSLLATECHERGVTFCAAVWDPAAIEWIDPFLMFYKIGSGDLTAYPLLDRIAAFFSLRDSRALCLYSYLPRRGIWSKHGIPVAYQVFRTIAEIILLLP